MYRNDPVRTRVPQSLPSLSHAEPERPPYRPRRPVSSVNDGVLWRTRGRPGPLPWGVSGVSPGRAQSWRTWCRAPVDPVGHDARRRSHTRVRTGIYTTHTNTRTLPQGPTRSQTEPPTSPSGPGESKGGWVGVKGRGESRRTGGRSGPEPGPYSGLRPGTYCESCPWTRKTRRSGSWSEPESRSVSSPQYGTPGRSWERRGESSDLCDRPPPRRRGGGGGGRSDFLFWSTRGPASRVGVGWCVRVCVRTFIKIFTTFTLGVSSTLSPHLWGWVEALPLNVTPSTPLPTVGPSTKRPKD